MGVRGFTVSGCGRCVGLFGVLVSLVVASCVVLRRGVDVMTRCFGVVLRCVHMCLFCHDVFLFSEPWLISGTMPVFQVKRDFAED